MITQAEIDELKAAIKRDTERGIGLLFDGTPHQNDLKEAANCFRRADAAMTHLEQRSAGMEKAKNTRGI